MAAGHARRVVAEADERSGPGHKALIVDRIGRPRWDDIWRGLDWIVYPGDRHPSAMTVKVRNGTQCRPYVAYPFNRKIGQRFTVWRAKDHLGAIVLFPEEVEFAARALPDGNGVVMVEPHLKSGSNPNKQWGWERWQALARILIREGWRVIQLGPTGTRALEGVDLIVTPTFRHAAAVLDRVETSILPEGGLHHAAGVLKRPSIVLFGGTISPRTTGYDWHRNIVSAEPGTPCGRWLACAHCARGWAALAPDRVVEEMRQFTATREAA